MAYDLTLDALSHFTGSEEWYQHSRVRRVRYTQGVRFVAVHGGAYWLIDEIALAQLDPERGRIRREAFQVWILNVDGDHKATLRCEDGNGGVVDTKTIDYSDFPLSEITLYFTDNCILLPSEY